MFVVVLAIILTLILVVGIHEAGHALMARVFLVKIKRVSIGFGKLLIQWKMNNGCEWVWAMWPLGGYVELLNTRISPVEPEEYVHCFDKKAFGIRLLVLLAGAGANLITAWLTFVLVFLMGLSYKLPQIQSVQPLSVAAQSGLASGDQFISVGGYATPSWQDVGMKLIIFWGNKDVKCTVRQANSGELKKCMLNLSQIKLGGREKSLLSSIGIVPSAAALNGTLCFPSLLAAIHQANKVIVQLIYFFMMVLMQLLRGVIPFSMLLGPVGLFVVSVASLTQGVVVFMYFIGSLSLAVALVNLFPIPGLDGGSMVYAIIEKIRGKPVSVALEILLHRLVFIVFCVMLAHLLMNDVQRFYS